MDKSSLRNLVWQPKENAKLDFKIEMYKIFEPKPSASADIQKWQEAKEQQWAELTKDVIAIANGNVGTAEETGYLIIGAKDKLGTDEKPMLRDVGTNIPSCRQVLDKVDSYCNPPLQLHCDLIKVDDINLFVISFPPSPHLHRLSKQLKRLD